VDTLSLETKAFNVALNRVRSWTDSNLLSVWEVAKKETPRVWQDGWGTNIGNSWVVITWDDWMDILYSELQKRGLSAL
jgi:hypothetical protein